MSGTQYLLGGPSLTLIFTGTLPTFVSMYVGAAVFDSVTVTALGPSGTQQYVTDGAYKNGDIDYPYRPRQFVSFASSKGISSIGLVAFYGLRADTQVDNVYFTSAVPEPASYLMLAAGLLVLGVISASRRIRCGKNLKADFSR